MLEMSKDGSLQEPALAHKRRNSCGGRADRVLDLHANRNPQHRMTGRRKHARYRSDPPRALCPARRRALGDWPTRVQGQLPAASPCHIGGLCHANRSSGGAAAEWAWPRVNLPLLAIHRPEIGGAKNVNLFSLVEFVCRPILLTGGFFSDCVSTDHLPLVRGL